MSNGSDYKASLNLPRTAFPMKADLPRREPEQLAAWERMGLEALRRRKAEGRPRFVMHDGPPYANGNIHIGHLMNKVLKDFIVRSRAMMGFDAPYVPGWDCHGLPIEQQVDKKLGSRKRDMTPVEIRAACREYAARYIDIQREEFKRLGVGGSWDRPYTTMAFPYEAHIAGAFGGFYGKNLVYQALKSVRWCFTDRTALAEAELEYEERQDPAIWVKFPLTEGPQGRPSFAVAWTTTPWTIPSNVAIAVHPEETYVMLAADDGNEYLVAEKLADDVAKAARWKEWKPVPGSRWKGTDLAGWRYRHPLPETMRGELTPEESAASFRFVVGDYVTMDTGTGLVHTAPGHGEDDFRTGQRDGLPILSPVDEAGRYTNVEKYKGQKVLDANREIVADLESAGALLHHEPSFRHEYPHCWRCKNPVIFRATVQWFVRLDDPRTDVRAGALEAISGVRWIPAWGEQRIGGMVENRREWVISRQRRWGSPITLLYAVKNGERGPIYPWVDSPAEQEKFFAQVVEIFRREGADAWYARPAADFLPEDADLRGFARTEFEPETDIMDVWFDSGVSHVAVLRSGEWPELVKSGDGPPADLYVEGHDQYRGWFQSSLLTSIALFGEAPFEGVVTHGFVVDGAGRKMSKSLGNVIAPQDLIKRYGADILRLWVASVDYRDDDPISEEILTRCAEAYRKMRNTARYLLSNLYDFPPAEAMPYEELHPLDRRVLRQTRKVARRVAEAYEAYEFHVVYHALLGFCTTTLSAFYLDVLKDRLYASPAASRERRSAQTALHRIARALSTLLAPVLPFTAEEIWEGLPPPKEQSVHLERFEALEDLPEDSSSDPAWDRLMKLRDEVAVILEEARREKIIGSSLEGAIRIGGAEALAGDLEATGLGPDGLADFFIVSGLSLNGPPEAAARASAVYEGVTLAFSRAPGRRCDRCWKVTPEADADGLCERCRRALGEAAA
jgi:isoleucyl-tRNA synthetase